MGPTNIALVKLFKADQRLRDGAAEDRARSAARVLVWASGGIEDGRIAEQWEVVQDEASQSDSKSGYPMFGDKFAN